MDSVLRRFGLKKGDQRDGRQAASKDLFAYSEVRFMIYVLLPLWSILCVDRVFQRFDVRDSLPPFLDV